MTWGLAIAVILLAYSNGANDNFKGAATLYGSGTLSYRTALLLASAATLAGSLSALARGSALLGNFSGRGLVPDSLASDPHFLAAVGLGAAVTILLATRLGLPVSTTHVSCGALFGVGLATRQARWRTIGRILLAWIRTLPVAAMPVVATLGAVFAVSL